MGHLSHPRFFRIDCDAQTRHAPTVCSERVKAAPMYTYRFEPRCARAHPPNPISINQGRWFSKWQVFVISNQAFWHLFILVPVWVVSFAAPTGVSKRMDFKLASSEMFEKLGFWCPFVLVPVWVPRIIRATLSIACKKAPIVNKRLQL